MQDDTPTIPPAFPLWMRAWDPYLAGEDENATFTAFRRRRKLYPPPLGGRIWRALRSPLIELGFNSTVLALALAAALFLPMTALIPLLGIAIVVSVLSNYIAKPTYDPNALPDRLSGVLTEGPPNRQAVADIYLAGASNRELCIALYLEDRDATWRQHTAAGVIGCGMLVLVYSFLGQPFSGPGFVFHCGLGVLCWKGLEAASVAHLGRFARRTLRTLSREWDSRSGLNFLTRELFWTVRTDLIMGVLAGLLMLVLGVAAFGLLHAAGAIRGTGSDFAISDLGYPIPVLAGIGFGLLAFGLHIVNTVLRRRHLAVFEQNLPIASEALGVFFARHFERV